MIDYRECLVLTGYDDKMASIGDLTVRGKKKYAERWGFDFKCHRDYSPDTHPAWQKLGIVRSALLSHKLVLWLDADILVTNPDVDFVQEIAKEHMGFTFSYDWEFTDPDLFTSCAFTVMSCPRSFRFLDEAMKQTRFSVVTSCTWDQEAMRTVNRMGGEWAETVRVLPHRELASVPTEVQRSVSPWQPGDFLCHLGGIPNEWRVVLFDKFTPEE